MFIAFLFDQGVPMDVRQHGDQTAGFDLLKKGSSQQGTLVNPLHDQEWDSKLPSHPNVSVFHTRAWASVLQRTYGFIPQYFALCELDRVHSLLPCMEINSPFTGLRAACLPFSDSCEPLFRDPESGKALLAEALAFAATRGWKSVEFRGAPGLLDNALASISFYEHTLDLQDDPERLKARVKPAVRRAIQKSQKSGVTVLVSTNWEATELYYRLHCKTRKRHGLPPQSLQFFRHIYEELLSQNLGNVVLAFYKGTPIAGNVFFYHRDKAIYKFGASDMAFQQLRGSNLVMWEGIKWLSRNGAKTLNLGRTSILNEGLRRFKLGWGTTETVRNYFRYDLRENRFVTDSDRATGRYNRIFKALPVALSRSIGAALYRHAA